MTLPQIIAQDISDKITHTQVLEFTADQLEKLTEDDLNKIYGEALNVTRPEYAGRQSPKNEQPVYISPDKKRKLAALQEAGVDISFLNRKKKR